MKVIYHPEASEDLEDSALYYEAAGEGLGERFLVAVSTTLDRLALFPEMGWEDQAGYRSFQIKRFPFNILYKPFPDYLYIVAVAHQSRRHGFWENRY